MSHRSTRRGRPLLFLLTLLAVYLLSFGPVQALYASHRLQGMIPNAVVVFYRPLHWLYQETALGKTIQPYDDWWKRVLKPRQ